MFRSLFICFALIAQIKSASAVELLTTETQDICPLKNGQVQVRIKSWNNRYLAAWADNERLGDWSNTATERGPGRATWILEKQNDNSYCIKNEALGTYLRRESHGAWLTDHSDPRKTSLQESCDDYHKKWEIIFPNQDTYLRLAGSDENGGYLRDNKDDPYPAAGGQGNEEKMNIECLTDSPTSSPTTSPTPPTPSPTPPTPSPTSAPTTIAEKIEAKGDPHVNNMRGEAFDVTRVGQHTLVEFPRGADDPELALIVRIARLSQKICESTFIEHAQIHGGWLGDVSLISFSAGSLEEKSPFQFTMMRPPFGEVSMDHSKMMSLHASVNISDATKERPRAVIKSLYRENIESFKIAFDSLTIEVQHIEHRHFAYLNIEVEGLSQLQTEVGGLLGLDSHTAETAVPSECKHKSQLFLLSTVSGI